MSKNMTRKGLALGTAAALSMSLIAAAPASATGIESSVTLVPKSGTEYSVLLDQYFEISSNFASGVAGTGKHLKFYVSDRNARVSVADASSSQYKITGLAATAIAGEDGTSHVLTVGSGHKFKQGDIVTVAVGPDGGTAVAGGSTVAGDFTISSVAASTISYTGTAGTAMTAGLISVSLKGTTFARSTTAATLNDFVFDTRSDSNSAAKFIRLSTTHTDTVSVTVTAWVDDDDDNVIDTTEYRSPARTVSFVHTDDLEAVTALESPVVGDTSLTATVSITPTLNGQQVLAQQAVFLNAKFGRQGTAEVRYAEAIQTGSATSTWNDTTKLFTLTIPLDVNTGAVDNLGIASNASGATHSTWGSDLVRPTSAAAQDGSPADTEPAGVLVSVTADDVATATRRDFLVQATPTFTNIAHNLRVGDKVTFGAGSDALLASKQFTVTAVPSSTTFQFALDVSAADTEVGTATATSYTVTTYTQTASRGNVSLIDRVIAGTYSAQAVIEETGVVGYADIGLKSTLGTVATTSADVIFSTVGTANVQGVSIKTSTNEVVKIKSGTLEVAVTVSVVDKDAKAVSAGRPVRFALTNLSAGVKVNGKTTDQTLLTDANGRVALTITSTTGASTERVTITATPEGQTGTAQSSIDVDWETQDYGLVDLNTTAASLGDSTRTIRAGGTYDMKLAVMDQWFTPAPSADYRLRVSGNGVTQGFVELVAGGATVKVTDPGIFTVAGQFVSTVDVQKKSSAGTWADTADDADITNVLVTSAGVTLAADASSIYSPTSTNADLSDAVAAAALVEIDSRLARTAEPDYKNSLLVSGVVANSATSAAANGAVVTISGPSNVLFKNGSVSKRGSLTLLANANGLFEVELFSTTAQTDSVITVTSLGGTATTKVTFTGIGVGEGTKLDVTAPASVRPASTFQVKAKLSDVFGNGVEATAGRVKVTYTGPGIVFGTLPDKTDKNGELMFSVLLGSNDTGNVVVTVSYDQNGDADYVDAKDLNTTKTITVGTGAASGTGKVNVGSFNGKLVVYAANLNGARISWKVGGNWGSAVADSNYDIFNRLTPRAGVTVSVDIYVNGVKTLTKSVVTR